MISGARVVIDKPMPPDVRGTLVKLLAEALAIDWRRKYASDQGPHQPTGVSRRGTAGSRVERVLRWLAPPCSIPCAERGARA